MALDTFANLKTEIAGWLHRDNLTSRIPGFITLAEADIGRELRVFRMESLETLSITSAQQAVSLPTRCRDVKWVKITGTKEKNVRSLPAAAFYNLYGQNGASSAQTGAPEHFTMAEGGLLVGPTPDDDYTAEALCILAPVALSDSNTSNAILANYPDIYLYGSLKHGFRYLRNFERMSDMEKAFNEAVAKANKESRKFGMSGTPDGVRSISRRKVV